MHQSPYCYAGNSPVTLTDVDGLAPGGPGGWKDGKGSNGGKVKDEYGTVGPTLDVGTPLTDWACTAACPCNVEITENSTSATMYGFRHTIKKEFDFFGIPIVSWHREYLGDNLLVDIDTKFQNFDYHLRNTGPQLFFAKTIHYLITTPIDRFNGFTTDPHAQAMKEGQSYLNLLMTLGALSGSTDQLSTAKRDELLARALEMNESEWGMFIGEHGTGLLVGYAMPMAAKFVSTQTARILKIAKVRLNLKVVLPRTERLAMFKKNLSKAANPTNPKEAIDLINKTMDEIELKHAGANDRMYGILDDKYVTYHSDGSVTAKTKGHQIEIQQNGMFSIYSRKSGELFFKK